MLAITDEEAEIFTGQLEDIIGFADKLKELDTENDCSDDASTTTIQRDA